MKCNWCPNETDSDRIEIGNATFCSKKCMNEFYLAYPNQKLKDGNEQDRKNFNSNLIFVIVVIVIIFFLVGTCVRDNLQNTTGEMVPETDVQQGYETETYPEENYEPKSETNSEKIIKKNSAGWIQCDANNTYNWVEYYNGGGIKDTYTLQKEDDNFYYLITLDGDWQIAIPKYSGMSYVWNEQSQTYVESILFY